MAPVFMRFRINNFVHLPLHSRFVNTIFQRFGLGCDLPAFPYGDEIKRFHNAAVIFFRKQNSVAVFGADVQRFIVLYGLLYIPGILRKFVILVVVIVHHLLCT